MIFPKFLIEETKKQTDTGDGARAVVVLVLMLAYEEFESRVLVPRIYGRALPLPSSVVLFTLLVGGTLMGILGALLALPVAATVMMLIEELRVELPGEQEQPVDKRQREADDRGEEEDERRTAGVGAEQAAAIAVEISRDRREEESLPMEAVGTTIESGNANRHEGSTTPVDKKGDEKGTGMSAFARATTDSLPRWLASRNSEIPRSWSPGAALSIR